MLHLKFLVQIAELDEVHLLQAAGFESVDFDEELLRTNPITPVLHKGVDLMHKLTADEYPSRLGRALRKELFGEDGLIDEMIEAENSPNRKEADPAFLTRKIFGNLFFMSFPRVL